MMMRFYSAAWFPADGDLTSLSFSWSQLLPGDVARIILGRERVRLLEALPAFRIEMTWPIRYLHWLFNFLL
jgi:hypothetical protein